MELTGEQVRVAETQLKLLRPHSQQVYGYLVLRHRVKADPIKVLVDQWPNFNAIVCQPTFEKKGDLFKDTCFFAKDEAILKETIRTVDIDWTKYLCFGLDLHHEQTVRAVASERGLSGSQVAVCHMMTLQDMSTLPPIDSSGVSIGSLDKSHVGLVNQTWKFGEEEHAVGMIHNMVANLPSCCVLDAEGRPVAWILTYPSCAMGMLYTLPGHRGKGYAKVLVSRMAQKLHDQGYPVYCFIEEENTLSYRMFTNLGFTEDPSYRATWISFNNL